MKKMFSLLMAACMICGMTACSAAGSKQSSAEVSAEWTRKGYFEDENGNMLSVVWMDEVDEPGWYVGAMLGEDAVNDSYGAMVAQNGNTLKGTLASSGDKEDINVTVSEEGEGLQLVVEGGETYHFSLTALPEASIIVKVNTEGQGNIAYTEGEADPEIDRDMPYQSAQINLVEPETYTFTAWAPGGSLFTKWTKDGEDFSTEPTITVSLDESAEYIAVFETDENWQNPVMNFVGDYQCDRANAHIECLGTEDALITIEWANSASETARWTIVGRLDTETLKIDYTGCSKVIAEYDENGEVKNEEIEYDDGTGTITFNDDGSFTWHDDKSGSGDMTFGFVVVD